MPSTAGPAPDASAMDASLEKVRKERAALRGDWFPRRTKESRRRRAAGPGRAGHVTGPGD